jgi:hypothetical protein
MEEKLNSGKLTHEQLKEVLKVNYDLYQAEPGFFEYLTTLVIYLMQYEFEWDGDFQPSSEGATAEKNAAPSQAKVGNITKSNIIYPEKKKDANANCSVCGSVLKPNTNICPFCLVMV